MDDAAESYKQGQYRNAIDQYNKYLEDEGEHGKFSSIARVRIGLAELREVHATKDWPGALKTAEDVLTRIPLEAEFKTARPELAQMLPDIAKGLADAAREKPSQQLLEKARKALDMAQHDEWVPKDIRPNKLLEDVTGSLAVTERELARG